MRQQGFHFRRQAPFRGYYLDFACFERKVVVELDGTSHDHPDQAAHDEIRDAVLRREDFTVLRFSNELVRFGIDDVVDAIWMAIVEAGPYPSRLRRATLPTEGEG